MPVYMRTVPYNYSMPKNDFLYSLSLLCFDDLGQEEDPET